MMPPMPDSGSELRCACLNPPTSASSHARCQLVTSLSSRRNVLRNEAADALRKIRGPLHWQEVTCPTQDLEARAADPLDHVTLQDGDRIDFIQFAGYDDRRHVDAVDVGRHIFGAAGRGPRVLRLWRSPQA